MVHDVPVLNKVPLNEGEIKKKQSLSTLKHV